MSTTATSVSIHFENGLYIGKGGEVFTGRVSGGPDYEIKVGSSEYRECSMTQACLPPTSIASFEGDAEVSGNCQPCPRSETI